MYKNDTQLVAFLLFSFFLSLAPILWANGAWNRSENIATPFFMQVQRLLMSVGWGTCWPCAFTPACSLLCPHCTACSCSTRVNTRQSHILHHNLQSMSSLSLKRCPRFLYGRPVNVPFCMGLPLGGRGGAVKHDPSHAERWPTVVGAQSCRCGLVDTQHQHAAENGGEGTHLNNNNRIFTAFHQCWCNLSRVMKRLLLWTSDLLFRLVEIT